VFCLFVGTGIGGSLIIDGQLINGAGFSAGEVGFLRLGGMAGTLEETSSAAQLVREVAAGRGIQPDSLDGEMIFAGAAKGEPDAVRAIDGMVQRLAQGIAAICYVVDPAVFIIGGGIMAQQAYLEPRLAAALAAEMVPAIRGHMQLAFAQLGNDAGMLGALRNFLQRQ
jgi:predicted NBD/HSP70 family sugar kinase